MNSYWVRGDDDEEYGPCDREELREWIGENRLGLDSLVRAGGQAQEWKPLQEYPELVVLIAESEVRSQRHDIVGGYPLAGYGRRILAGTVDILILMVLWIFATIIILLASQVSLKDLYELGQKIQEDSLTTVPMYAYIIQAAGSAIIVAYMTFFIGRDGQTPGMQAFSLRAVDAKGMTVNFLQALVRAVMFWLSFNLWGVGFLLALFTAKRQTVHDLLGGTYVIQLPKRPAKAP